MASQRNSSYQVRFEGLGFRGLGSYQDFEGYFLVWGFKNRTPNIRFETHPEALDLDPPKLERAP